MLSKSFIPLTRKPTRISDSTSTLIDNIFVNGSFSDITSGIIVSDVTDHFPIYALVSNFLYGNFDQSPTSGIRVMSESNLNKLSERLRSADWSSVYNQTNLNSCFESFLDILTTNYNSSIPLKRPNRSNYTKRYQDNHGSQNLSLSLLIVKTTSFTNTEKIQIYQTNLVIFVIVIY